jgi:hypothetical protein
MTRVSAFSKAVRVMMSLGLMSRFMSSRMYLGGGVGLGAGQGRGQPTLRAGMVLGRLCAVHITINRRSASARQGSRSNTAHTLVKRQQTPVKRRSNAGGMQSNATHLPARRHSSTLRGSSAGMLLLKGRAIPSASMLRRRAPSGRRGGERAPRQRARGLSAGFGERRADALSAAGAGSGRCSSIPSSGVSAPAPAWSRRSHAPHTP